MEDPCPVENIDRLGVLMFQPSYIFNRENPQNSEPQNGPRRKLDFIDLHCAVILEECTSFLKSIYKGQRCMKN